MHFRNIASLLLVLIASAGCAAPDPPDPGPGPDQGTPTAPTPAVVEVFKPTNGRQCENDSVPLEEHAAELQRAGVAIANSRTGMVPGIDVVMQLCGSPTQTANYFSINPADLEKAEAIGFRRASETVVARDAGAM